MSYAPKIYDWRARLKPVDQLFRAGGEGIDGGITAGGARVGSPEPGGYAELDMAFPQYLGADTETGRDVSWTVSRILNSAIFRVPLCVSPQLVSHADLGGPDGGLLLWDSDQLWSNGQPWAFEPVAPVTAAAEAGAVEVIADLSGYGEVLGIGHVIGFRIGAFDFAHVVMDISYDSAGVASFEVSPPLRRALTAETELQFRPKMLVTCANAREIAAAFRFRRFASLNAASFVEALV